MKLLLFSLMFMVAVSCPSVFGQTEKVVKSDKSSEAYIYDKWLRTYNSEDCSARFDGLMNAVTAQPGSSAVIVFYCGKECFYGEFEAHFRGIVTMKLDEWHAKRDQVVIIHGGYREESVIEVWIVPKGANLPVPKPSLKFEDIKFKGAYKYKRVAYDCCEDI